MRHLSRIHHGIRILWSGGRGKILLAIAAGWFLSIGVRLVYPVLLPYLQTAYGLDLTTAGGLLTVLWLAYAVGQLPSGILSDRIGEGRILMVSSVASTGTLTLVVFAGSATVLFVATALFGISTALYGVARYTAMAEIYPDNDGAAIGVTLAAGEIGNATLPAVAGLIAATVAWQYGFGFTIPLFAVVAVVLWAVVPAQVSGDTSAVDTVSFETSRYIFSELMQPTILLVTLIQILTYSVWQAFTGFYPIYLIEIKGIAPTVATGVFSMFFALGIIIQPLTGGIYDRIGIRRSLPIILSVVTTALMILPFIEDIWLIIGDTILLSTILGYGTITIPYMTRAMPRDMQGTGLGVLRTIYMTVGAASPTLFGALAERGFFDEAFLALAALAATAIILSTRIPE